MNHINTYEPSPDSVQRHGLRSGFITDAVCVQCAVRAESVRVIWIKLTKNELRKAGLWTEI